ncbi:hypothetical protein CYMTET_21129, partial [Cymbomonas tetramitiformis]
SVLVSLCQALTPYTVHLAIGSADRVTSLASAAHSRAGWSLRPGQARRQWRQRQEARLARLQEAEWLKAQQEKLIHEYLQQQEWLHQHPPVSISQAFAMAHEQRLTLATEARQKANIEASRNLDPQALVVAQERALEAAALKISQVEGAALVAAAARRDAFAWAINFVQAHRRMLKARRRFTRLRAVVVAVQRRFRVGWNRRHRDRTEKIVRWAQLRAEWVQAAAAKGHLRECSREALRTQANFRMRKWRLFFLRHRFAVVCMQAAWRGRRDRHAFSRQKGLVRRLQLRARRRYRRRSAAVVVIQRRFCHHRRVEAALLLQARHLQPFRVPPPGGRRAPIGMQVAAHCANQDFHELPCSQRPASPPGQSTAE